MTNRESLAFSIIGIVLLVGFFLARQGGFFRSGEWMVPGIVVSIVAAGLTSAWLTRIVFRSRLRIRSFTVGRFFQAAVIWALFAILGSICFFFTVAYAVPDFYTRATGVEREARYTDLRLQSRRESSRLRYRWLNAGCRHFVSGPAFARGGYHAHYCASGDESDSLPSDGTFRVRWRESWFGRSIEAVELATNGG